MENHNAPAEFNAEARSKTNLIGIGPNVIVTGDAVKVSDREWQIRIEDFVAGDRSVIIDFINTFQRIKDVDKYLLVNSFGEGRNLLSAPKLSVTDEKLSLHFQVLPPYQRADGSNIGRGIKMNFSIDGATFDTNNEVSGINALFQNFHVILGTDKGSKAPFPDEGSRITEYYLHFGEVEWFDSLIKLECIRLASIPIGNVAQLHAVKSVNSVRLLDKDKVVIGKVGKVLRIAVEFEIEGVGAVPSEIMLYIAKKHLHLDNDDETQQQVSA